MPRIRGKFAPFFDELGNDPRWIMDCNDFQKFMFMLVLYTIYMNNGTAPDEPRYYKRRYALGHRLDTIRTGLEHIKGTFPKLLCTSKNLSLLNYVGYENTVPKSVPEKENKKEKENKNKKESYHEAPEVSQLATQILEYWNAIPTLPRALSMGGVRREKLKTRLENPLFRTRWKEAIERVGRSLFATGRKPDKDGRAWKAGIDWFLDNDTNFMKVLEGKYDDDTKDAVDVFAAGLGRTVRR